MIQYSTPPRLVDNALVWLGAALGILCIGAALASSLHLIPWDALYRPDSSWATLAHPEIGTNTVTLCAIIASTFLGFVAAGWIATRQKVQDFVGPGLAVGIGRLATAIAGLAVACALCLLINMGRTVGAVPPAGYLISPLDGPQLAIAFFLHPADETGVIVTIPTLLAILTFGLLGLYYAQRLLGRPPAWLNLASHTAAGIAAGGAWLALDRMFPGEPVVPLSTSVSVWVIQFSLLAIPVAYVLLIIEVAGVQAGSVRRLMRSGQGRRRQVWAIASSALATLVGLAAMVVPVLLGLYLALLFEPPANSVVQDRTGTILDVRHPGNSTLTLPSAEMPLTLLQAVESIEDPGLLTSPATHPPVNPVTILGSVTRIREGQVTGASGVAAQVCKLWLGSPLSSRGWGNTTYALRLIEKGLETPCAWTLEKVGGPERTLSLWLTMADYSCLGGYGASEIRGATAASWVFFGKSPDHLTVPEAALLARLPQNPCGLYAWGEIDNMLAGRNQVIDAMGNRQGYLDPIDTALYKAIPLGVGSEPFMPPREALPFVEAAMGELEEHGVSDLSRSGMTVHTTLHPDLQLVLDMACTNAVASQWMTGVNDCGAIWLHRDLDNPDRFEVVAYLGTIHSITGPEAMPDLVVDQHLPPGSTIKGPLYACALNHGVLEWDEIMIDPGTVVIDGERIANWDLDGVGAQPASQMLAWSRNVPAAYLVSRLGPERFTRCLADQFGIESEIDHAGWGVRLGLGVAPISLKELAISYTPFVTGGSVVTPVMVTEVINRDGGVELSADPPAPNRAVACHEAAWVTDALLETGQAYGFPEGVALKTGTTDHSSVAVAYSPDWVVAVWLGHIEPRQPLQPIHEDAAAVVVARDVAFSYYSNVYVPPFSACGV